jgi:hypothetical protein
LFQVARRQPTDARDEWRGGFGVDVKGEGSDNRRCFVGDLLLLLLQDEAS